MGKSEKELLEEFRKQGGRPTKCKTVYSYVASDRYSAKPKKPKKTRKPEVFYEPEQKHIADIIQTSSKIRIVKAKSKQIQPFNRTLEDFLRNI